MLRRYGRAMLLLLIVVAALQAIASGANGGVEKGE